MREWLNRAVSKTVVPVTPVPWVRIPPPPPHAPAPTHGWYRRRRDRRIARLADRGLAVSGIAAGLHVLAHLRGASEREVTEQAAQRGLALDALADCAAPSRDGPPALVSGYARPPAHA